MKRDWQRKELERTSLLLTQGNLTTTWYFNYKIFLWTWFY